MVRIGGSKSTVLEFDDGTESGDYFKVTETSLRFGSGPRMEVIDDTMVYLSRTGISIDRRAAGFHVEIELKPTGIRLRYGTNSISLSATGIKIVGARLELSADVTLSEKAPLGEKKISGIVKQQVAFWEQQ